MNDPGQSPPDPPRNEDPPPAPAETPPGEQGEGEPITCPVFVPSTLQRQVVIDNLIWWPFRIAFMFMIMAIVILGMLQSEQSQWLPLFFVFCALGWIVVSIKSAKIAQQLPQLTELLDADPEQAETALARALGAKPLQRGVRLLLYHRLAMLRRRQQRFGETAAICQAVLAYPLGSAAGVRGHLLLMACESMLQCNDLWGAWSSLATLHKCKLNLIETMQLLALQTRYEVSAGYHAAALERLDQKIATAELMPAPQCGAMHAMLAAAARHCKREQTADWLGRRAELLCPPDQMQWLTPLCASDGDA